MQYENLSTGLAMLVPHYRTDRDVYPEVSGHGLKLDNSHRTEYS